MRSVLTLVSFAVACAAACAAPNFDEPTPLPTETDPASPRDRGRGGPAPLPTSSSNTLPGPSPEPSSTSSAPSPSPSTPPPSPSNNGGADAGTQVRRWKGALAATLPVEFGGGQECKYRITLKQVTVDVTAAGNEIVAATVTALAFEEVLSAGCNNTPIPAHTHTYALTIASVLAGGVSRLELAGPSTNHPAAALVVQGDFRTTNPSLSLQWHRTDYGPPLDWRVSANVQTTLQ